MSWQTQRLKIAHIVPGVTHEARLDDATKRVHQLQNEARILHRKTGAWHSARYEPFPASFWPPHLNPAATVLPASECLLPQSPDDLDGRRLTFCPVCE